MDPYDVLEIDENVTDKGVHKAYLEHVRRYPPDRAPEQFQAVRRAYEQIKTARARSALRIFGFPRVPRFADMAPVTSGMPTLELDLWRAVLSEQK